MITILSICTDGLNKRKSSPFVTLDETVLKIITNCGKNTYL